MFDDKAIPWTASTSEWSKISEINKRVGPNKVV